ncbi:MAG: DUF2063 domain-containing protein [Prochlorococcus sp.]
MKSLQIIRSQQQYLASLHRQGPTPWFVNAIIPAIGFKDSTEVLEIYLQRSVSRTIDPLRKVFISVGWLVGEENLDRLLKWFYAYSPGEPLSAQILASEFESFVGDLDENLLDEIIANRFVGDSERLSLQQALMAAAMLDWRSHWVQLHRSCLPESRTKEIRDMRRHTSPWARPQLDKTARLCESGVDLAKLFKLALNQEPSQPIPLVENNTADFLIHADLEHVTQIRQLDQHESRLLNHCDGTHTYASLRHEASFHGRSWQETDELLACLIEQGVITQISDSSEYW